MRWTTKLLATAVIAATIPGSAVAGTFYVSPAGSDGNSGTSEATPWRTLARVDAAHLQPGDTVLLQGGEVWKESLQPESSGTASAPISFGSYGYGKAIIDGTGSSAWSGIVLTRVSHLAFRNLEIRGFSGYGDSAVYALDGSDITLDGIDARNNYSGVWSSSTDSGTPRVQILNSRFSGLSTAGIQVYVGNVGSIGWTLENDEIANAGDSCVIDRAGESVYDNVRIHHCGYAAPSAVPWPRHGIYAKGPDITVRDSKIWDVNTSAFGGQCLSMREGGLVEGNTLHGCTGGIGFFDYTRRPTQTLTIRRNQIWDFGAWGLYLDPVGTNGENPYNVPGHSETFNVVNNTIVSTGPANAVLAIAGAEAGYTAYVNVDNNVLIANHRGDATLTVLESLGSPGRTVYAARANMLWNSAGPTYLKYRGTMTRKPSAIPGERESTVSNPRFRSLLGSHPDFRLTASSPAIDDGIVETAGGAFAPTCNGGILSYCGSAPDAGAYESSVSTAKRR